MEVIVKDMKIDKNANDNIDNGGRIATATLLINNMFLIHCVTLVSGKNGIFVSMPSIKKSDGSYQDYAFFTTKEEREKAHQDLINIMKEYGIIQDESECEEID